MGSNMPGAIMSSGCMRGKNIQKFISLFVSDNQIDDNKSSKTKERKEVNTSGICAKIWKKIPNFRSSF
jgi:hypothetical protein